MFFRQKPAGPYRYIQIVENRREGGKVRQRTLMTVGRLDKLQASGRMDALIRSGMRFCEKLAVIDAASDGEGAATIRIGPDLVFGRLWERLGIQTELRAVLKNRRFGFDVERAIYLTVLHRLCVSGSDRAAEKWRRDYRIPGAEALDLHQLYRAMAFLGDELPAREQEGRTPFSPRCTKDVIEERLFARRRDLFTDLQLVFFDTTSIYFEGEGAGIGQHGNSKDHRPDCTVCRDARRRIGRALYQPDKGVDRPEKCPAHRARSRGMSAALAKSGSEILTQSGRLNCCMAPSCSLLSFRYEPPAKHLHQQ